MERYQGKKVVIIGGTSGMGLATAKLLIDGGARVLVTGLSKAGLDSARIPSDSIATESFAVAVETRDRQVGVGRKAISDILSRSMIHRSGR
jgi:NAD(P)-dependent dehydrogenase (short-subunit alcohol dehydrogenase family)